jgi:hypothetical protein
MSDLSKENPASGDQRGRKSFCGTYNSAKSQCHRLLEYLIQHGRITTVAAHEKLDIYHPPARKLQLVKAGHNIVTHFRIDYTAQGNAHRVGEYVLLGLAKDGGEHVV